MEDGVQTIGSRAFFQCENIVDVTVEGCVLNLQADAFYRCTNLKHIYYECSDLESVEIENGNDSYKNAVWHAMHSERLYEDMRIICLSIGLKELHSHALSGTVAQVIIIPEGCAYISEDVFDNCSQLVYIID